MIHLEVIKEGRCILRPVFGFNLPMMDNYEMGDDWGFNQQYPGSFVLYPVMKSDCRL